MLASSNRKVVLQVGLSVTAAELRAQEQIVFKETKRISEKGVAGADSFENPRQDPNSRRIALFTNDGGLTRFLPFFVCCPTHSWEFNLPSDSNQCEHYLQNSFLPSWS
jgi:hypothetical protein